MNATATILAADTPKRPVHPLRAWRKGQMVDDPDKGGRRTMRLTDVQRLYGIPFNTWAAWEKWPGEPGYRKPDDDNMARIFEITKREITPNDFYLFTANAEP